MGRRFNVAERHRGMIVRARRRADSELQDSTPFHEYLVLDGNRSMIKVIGTNSVSAE